MVGFQFGFEVSFSKHLRLLTLSVSSVFNMFNAHALHAVTEWVISEADEIRLYLTPRVS